MIFFDLSKRLLHGTNLKILLLFSVTRLQALIILFILKILNEKKGRWDKDINETLYFGMVESWQVLWVTLCQELILNYWHQ